MDHSYVEELIHAGIMEREEGRFHPKKNVITRALGTVMATPDFFEFEPKMDICFCAVMDFPI